MTLWTARKMDEPHIVTVSHYGNRFTEENVVCSPPQIKEVEVPDGVGGGGGGEALTLSA